MARINIEDSIYRDERYQNLLLSVGCKYKALGLMAAAWSLAQKYWLKYKAIPKSRWPESLNILIETNLATQKIVDGNEFVYVRGSKEQFRWLEQCSESGKRSAIARGPRSTAVEGSLTEVPRLGTSYSYSPSSSFLASNEANAPKEIYISSDADQNSKNQNITPKKEVFGSLASLIEAVPIVTRDKWSHRYRDWAWVEEQCSAAFEFHTSDPGAVPATRGVWMKKLHTWLENSWAKKLKETKPIIISAEESALFREEQ